MNPDATPAVTPEEEEAFCSLALRSSVGPALEGQLTAKMFETIHQFRQAVDALLFLGWQRRMLSAVDGTEAMVLVHQADGPIKATFCGDWDGSWFAELVDGELTPIQPILFFPLRRMPR
jgi:hypothetical protein